MLLLAWFSGAAALGANPVVWRPPTPQCGLLEAITAPFHTNEHQRDVPYKQTAPSLSAAVLLTELIVQSFHANLFR